MPSIPKRRLRYLPAQQARQPTGDQGFYQSPAWRKTRIQKLQISPICEASAAKGEYIDCTHGGHIDHIIRIDAGGAPLDLRNTMTLTLEKHNRKSALEKNGLAVNGVGEHGQLIPAHGERERIIKLINKADEDCNS